MKWNKFIVVSFVFLFFSEISFSQIRSTTSIPELESSLETSKDIERIKILHQLGSLERFSNPDKALRNSEESLILARELKNDSLVAESNFRIGMISSLQGNLPLSIEKLIDAQTMFKREGYVKREMSVLNSLASVYVKIGQFDKASEINFRALEYGQENNNVPYIIFALTRIGVIQRDIGDFESSERYLKEATEKAIDYDNWIEGTMAFTELGNLESTRGNVDSAVVYFEKAIDWLQEKNSVHAIPSLLLNVGALYKDFDRLEEALRISKEAVLMADSMNSHLFSINARRDLADVYRRMGEHDSSIVLIHESLGRIGKTEQSSLPKLQLLNLLADNYYHIGEFEKASEAAEKASTIAFEKSAWINAQEALIILIESEVKIGRPSSAVEYQKKLMAVKDSLTKEDRAKKVLEFDAKYRMGQKEQEIALLEAENQQKSTTQRALAIGVVLVIAIAFLVIRSQILKVQKTGMKLENEELKRKRLEQELDFKNKQLVTQSLNIVQKKELMIEMKEKVETFEEGGSKRELSKLSNLIDYSFTLDKDWHEFRMRFEEVHTNFYHVLKENYGELSPNELKLSALVKLNLSIKEMAAILGISTEGVKKARYRLRKKLNLDTETNLVEFMLELEKKSLQYT